MFSSIVCLLAVLRRLAHWPELGALPRGEARPERVRRAVLTAAAGAQSHSPGHREIWDLRFVVALRCADRAIHPSMALMTG